MADGRGAGEEGETDQILCTIIAVSASRFSSGVVPDNHKAVIRGNELDESPDSSGRHAVTILRGPLFALTKRYTVMMYSAR